MKVQDPNVQGAVASTWAGLQASLTSATELAQGFEKAQEFAKTWGQKREFFEGGDVREHAKELTKSISAEVEEGNNVLISFAEEEDLPVEAIRGTQFEKLMVAMLQNRSMAGAYAVHAEPGAGKSTAATLAALELKGRRPKDVIVLLQSGFQQCLESFFCADIKYAQGIARPFFRGLRQKGIRLRLIFDNCLDGGRIGEQSEDALRVLAKAANDHLHQVIVIMQTEEAAQVISDLNGDTTNKASQMPAEYYRWSREETLELLNRTTNIEELLKQRLGEADLNILKDLALERATIPDPYGRWRPRSTMRYITIGATPKGAPLPGLFEMNSSNFMLRNARKRNCTDQAGVGPPAGPGLATFI